MTAGGSHIHKRSRRGPINSLDAPVPEPQPEPQLLEVSPAEARGYDLAFQMLQVSAGELEVDDAAPEITRGPDGVLELKHSPARPKRMSA